MSCAMPWPLWRRWAVTRRRGKGTIANPQMPMPTFVWIRHRNFFHAMEEAGYHPRIESLNLGFVFKNDPAFGPGSTSYLNTEKLGWLEDKVAAYCTCRPHLTGRFASGAKDSIFALQEMGHYQFLEQYCHTTTFSHIDAAIPPPAVSESLTAALRRRAGASDGRSCL